MSPAGKTDLLALRNRVVGGDAGADERARFAAIVGRLEHHPSAGLLGDLLQDEDEIVRYNALHSLVLKLGQRGPEMVQACRRLLRDDPDSDIRRLALTCLGSINFGSFDVEFFEWVRDSLREQRFEPNLVETAYQVLFQIPGRAAAEWPDRKARSYMDYAEIDWDEVAELETEVREGAERSTRG